MEITTKDLFKFEGGQLTVDVDEQTKYCGEIKKARVTDSSLQVEFAWRASWNAATQTWKNVHTFLWHGIGLPICGTPEELDDGSIVVHIKLVAYPDYKLIFRKADDPNKLDPAKVEGLLAKAA